MKKYKFVTLKKRRILVSVLCICSLLVCLLVPKLVLSSSPRVKYSIVLDAGHGGIDGGCVGKETGITESQLNLEYAFQLKDLCEEFGVKVILTRSTMDGLYSPFASNKKRSEMEKRENIIKTSNADMLISIHMNSLPSRSIKGAQVFYKKGSDHSREFATQLTSSLKTRLHNIRGNSKEGDFYVLNCNNKPAVLLECGYLSNSEEEKLLISEDYKKSFCEAIFYGILNFLQM